VFGITIVPPSLADLFRGGVFCSVNCIRAFCVDTLEKLEALDTPDSKSMVSDIQEVLSEVSDALAILQGRLGA
jgi:hypothetical protein